MPLIAPPAVVIGAGRQPLPYGLFSTFLLRPPAGDRWESGVIVDPDTVDPVGGIGAFQCSASDQAVQTIDFGGTGLTSFTLTYAGETTASLNNGATAAAVQTALLALDALVSGDITVSGGPVPSDIVVTFAETVPNPDLISVTVTPGTATATVTGAAAAGREDKTLGLPKDLDPNRPEDWEATPFTVYGHFQCSPMGFTPAEAQAKAQLHLLSREEQRVEQALWTGDLGNRPRLRGAADINSGTALSPEQAIGALEEYIAQQYGSMGVIHVTRATALNLIAADLLMTSTGRMTTVLGTPVAAGSGYDGSGPNAEAAAAGVPWAYVTPALFGYRSEVFTSSNRAGDLLDRDTNDLYAVAERSYLLGFDPIGVGAVKITLN